MFERVLVSLAAVASVVSMAACTGDSEPGLPVRCNATVNVDPKYPSESFADWVTFGRQVSVVRVLREELREPGPADAEPDGVLLRWVVGEVERTPWTHPRLDPLSGEISWQTWSVDKDDRQPAHPCDYEVGKSYLVPLAEFDGVAAPLNVAPVVLVEGVLPAAEIIPYRWLETFSGASMDEVERQLSIATPGTPVGRFGFPPPTPVPPR